MRAYVEKGLEAEPGDYFSLCFRRIHVFDEPADAAHLAEFPDDPPRTDGRGEPSPLAVATKNGGLPAGKPR